MGNVLVKEYVAEFISLKQHHILLEGFLKEDWKMRKGCLGLAKHLFQVITDAVVKEVVEEEEVAEDAAEWEDGYNVDAIILEMGPAMYKSVLVHLYCCRQDNVAIVANEALTIWKMLVGNTPRTLKDSLPSILGLIVQLYTTDSVLDTEEPFHATVLILV